MTDIEQKALALVNEVQKVRGHTGSPWNSPAILNEALYRAIEQHEAFRQEVSDAVEHCRRCSDPEAWTRIKFELARFITAKPDPLVEAIDEVDTGPIWDGTQDYANKIRAAIEKRGGKIVWGEG